MQVDTFVTIAEPVYPDTMAPTVALSVNTLSTSTHPEAAVCTPQNHLPRGKQPRSHKSIWDAHEWLLSIWNSHNTPRPKNCVYTARVLALRGFQRYQKTSSLLICQLPFQQLIIELGQRIGSTNFWLQTSALNALQGAAEAYLGRIFKETDLCTKVISCGM